MTTVAGTQDRHQEFMRNTGNAGEMDKNSFLKLLITQMRYQDPLKPNDNGEFLAQMSQFSSLEQVQNISAGLDLLIAGQGQQQARLLEKVDYLNESIENLLMLAQLNHFNSFDQQLLLLGKDVTMRSADGFEVTGKVSAVKFTQAGAQLVVNGETFSLAQLVKVESGE